jgi:hypothetical protein
VVVQENVQASGYLTLSREVLEEAGIHPGDVARVEVTGPHRIEITVVSSSSEEMAAQPGEPRETGPLPWSPTIGRGDAVDPDTLPTWTLEDMLERFQIEAPIDFGADQEAWHDVAAKEVFGERPERSPSYGKPSPVNLRSTLVDIS